MSEARNWRIIVGIEERLINMSASIWSARSA